MASLRWVAALLVLVLAVAAQEPAAVDAVLESSPAPLESATPALDAAAPTPAAPLDAAAAPLTVHMLLDDGRGHLDAYSDLALELAARGHAVSVLMPARAAPWVDALQRRFAAGCALAAASPQHLGALPAAAALLAHGAAPGGLAAAARAHCDRTLRNLAFVPFSATSEDNFTSALEATTRRGYESLGAVRELLRVVAALHAAWLRDLAQLYGVGAAAAASATSGPRLARPDVLLVDVSKPTGMDAARLLGLLHETVRLAPASSAALADRPLWYPSLSGEPLATRGTLERAGRLLARWLGLALVGSLEAHVAPARAEHGLLPPHPPPGADWAAPPPVLAQWAWGLEWPHAAHPAAERIGPARNWALLDAVRSLQPFGAAADAACGNEDGGDSAAPGGAPSSPCRSLEAWLAAPALAAVPVVYASLGTALVADERILAALARALLAPLVAACAPGGGGAADAAATSPADAAAAGDARCHAAHQPPPYRVVWSVRNASALPAGLVAALPRGWLLTLPRVPQEALLAHPSVRAFVTHGGLNSLLQALDAGVPLLCVPFAYDQPENCAAAAQRGAGVTVDWRAPELPDAVRSALAALLAAGPPPPLPGTAAAAAAVAGGGARNAFAAAAARLGAISRTAGGLARAVQVVERTARLGSAFLADPAHHPPGPPPPPPHAHAHAHHHAGGPPRHLSASAGGPFASPPPPLRLSWLQATYADALLLLAAVAAAAAWGVLLAARAARAAAGGPATTAGWAAGAAVVAGAAAGTVAALHAVHPPAGHAAALALGAAVAALGACALLLEAVLAWLVLQPLPVAPSVAPLVRCAANGREARGLTVWGALEAEFIFGEIFGPENTYGQPPLLFGPGMTILDAGGNIGLFALYAAGRCGGDATVHSFEPIPHVHAALAANGAAAMGGRHARLLASVAGAGGCGATPRLHAHRLALGAAPGPAVFAFHPLASGWSSMTATFGPQLLGRMAADLALVLSALPLLGWALPPAAWGWFVAAITAKAGVSVPVHATVDTLDAFLESPAFTHTLPPPRRDGSSDSAAAAPAFVIDLLKVDVEGAELAVLAGLTRAAHWDALQQLAVEATDFAVADAIAATLAARGDFVVSRVASERERIAGSASEQCMVYARRRGYTGPAGPSAAAAARRPAAAAVAAAAVAVAGGAATAAAAAGSESLPPTAAPLLTLSSKTSRQRAASVAADAAAAAAAAAAAVAAAAPEAL